MEKGRKRKKIAQKKVEHENWMLKKINAIKKREKEDKKYEKRMTWVWAVALMIWIFVVFYAAEIIVALIMHLVIERFQWIAIDMDTSAVQMVFMALSYMLAFAIMIIVPKKFLNMKVTRDSLGLRGLPTWTDILLSPVGCILSLVVSLAVMYVIRAYIPGIDWSEAQDVGFNNVISGIDKIITFVALVILAPIAEELIFRGFLYGKLRTRLSAVPAIILVSILFGFVHGQWNVGIIAAIMSIFMCLAREITGTIYAGILIHMIRNGLAFYLLYIMDGTIAIGAVIPLSLLFLV